MTKEIVLENDKLKLKVVPELGGSISEFSYYLQPDWVEVFKSTPERTLAGNDLFSFSSFNLFPYSNRLKNGEFKYQGISYHLPIDRPENDGHALHGETYFRPWTIEEQSPLKIKLSFFSEKFTDLQWPFPFKAEVTYQLVANKLLIGLSLENIGLEKMPAGMGVHPYFKRKITEQDETIWVHIPLKGYYPGDSVMPESGWIDLPERLNFNEKRIFTTEFLDRCFRAKNGDIQLEWPGTGLKLTMEKDNIFNHIVIYRPEDRNDFFAIEPVTNANNSFNLADQGIADSGMIELEPAEKITGQIAFKITNNK